MQPIASSCQASPSRNQWQSCSTGTGCREPRRSGDRGRYGRCSSDREACPTGCSGIQGSATTAPDTRPQAESGLVRTHIGSCIRSVATSLALSSEVAVANGEKVLCLAPIASAAKPSSSPQATGCTQARTPCTNLSAHSFRRRRHGRHRAVSSLGIASTVSRRRRASTSAPIYHARPTARITINTSDGVP
jgi:hypothetical protein